MAERVTACAFARSHQSSKLEPVNQRRIQWQLAKRSRSWFAVHSSELYGAKATAGDDGLCHLLTFDFEGSGEPPATLTLHPWNHAPREPAARRDPALAHVLGDFADDWLLLNLVKLYVS